MSDLDGGAGGGEDRISDLPDDILRSILLLLPSTVDAARTSLLSRRWRRVWTGLPELSFSWSRVRDPSPCADAVDAALAAHDAPEIHRLSISIETCDSKRPVHAARVDPWLRFASRRLAGEVSLRLAGNYERYHLKNSRCDEIELPVCERATAISMDTRYHSFRFLHGGAQPPPTTFAALRVLNIGCSVFHVSEMERLISSLCPRLQDLTLQTYFELEGVFNFSVRSETLERLDLRVSRVNGRLTVEAPRLVRLAVSEIFITPSLDPQHAARIAAPKLAEVSWYDVYDALRHQFVVAPRRLRKLQVRTCYMDERNMRWSKLAAGLLQRFDAVDELELDLDIVIGQIPYKLFLKDTAKLPECKVLKIRFISNCSELQHCASSTVMHLISKCTGITRLDIRLDRSLWFRQIGENLQQITCPTFRNRRGENNCPCWQPEDEITDGIILDSLEELYIINFTGADDEVDMVKLLLRCKLIPRRVAFRLPNDMNNEMCEKVREKITSLFLPNTKLEIYWNRTLLQKSKSIGIPNLFG